MEYSELKKNFEDALVGKELNAAVPERLRKLTTKDGFTDAFWEIVRSKDITHLAAYETLENEYRAYFKNKKYKNFASFRRRRDSEHIDEDNEYMYVFYDPLDNTTFIGISTAPEMLFRTMMKANPQLIYATLRRNFDIDFALGLMEDYKIGDRSYRMPSAIYYMLVGSDNPAQYKQQGFTKDFVDLLIKYRGKPGVYAFENSDGEILYVGVTKDLHQRPKGSVKERFKYYPEALYIKLYPCNKADSIILETYLIAHHRPIFNRLGSSSSKPTLTLISLPDSTIRVRVNNVTVST